MLQTLGGFYIDNYKLGILDRSKSLYRRLLKKKYTPLENTVFYYRAFNKAC